MSEATTPCTSTLSNPGSSRCRPDPERFQTLRFLLKDYENVFLLNWDKGEAEAEAAVATAGAVVVPARRTAAPRAVAPTAATAHAVRAFGITIGTVEFCPGIVGF